MATILGGLTTSHIPLIGKAIAQDLRNEPYWQPFFRGFPAAFMSGVRFGFQSSIRHRQIKAVKKYSRSLSGGGCVL